MSDIFDKILKDSHLKLIRVENETVLLLNENSVYPENCVEIKKDKTYYAVSEIHRNSTKLVKEIKNKDEAKVWAIVIAKKMFDSLNKEEVVDLIEELVEEGNEEHIPKLLNEIGFTNYCIGREDSNKISLIHLEENMDIKYNGKFIVEQVKIKRAYIVLYNYCNKLKNISDFCHEINTVIKIDNINYQELIEVYMF